MAKCLFCTIRLGCPRIASGALDAPFAQFAPPALNNFRHPWPLSRLANKRAVSIMTNHRGVRQLGLISYAQIIARPLCTR